MREEAADRDVVDRLPTARTDISGKVVEVSGVSLDGVRRGVALAQVAQKVVGSTFDNSARLFHDLVILQFGNLKPGSR